VCKNIALYPKWLHGDGCHEWCGGCLSCVTTNPQGLFLFMIFELIKKVMTYANDTKFSPKMSFLGDEPVTITMHSHSDLIAHFLCTSIFLYF
jgi:hypothetical protein